MKVDQRLIKEAIHATEAEIRSFKKARSLPPGGWPGYAESAAKDYATQLYSIQAHRRGKIHLVRQFASLEEQEVFISATREKFLFPGQIILTSNPEKGQSDVAAG